MSARPIVRCPVMVPLNDVRGAVSGAAMAVPARARPTVLVTSVADGLTSRARCSGRPTVLSTPRPSSSAGPGSRRWVASGAGASGASVAERAHR